MLLQNLIRLADPARSVVGVRDLNVSNLEITGLDVPDLEVLGIAEDSRQVRPGDLFIARPGFGAHQNGAHQTGAGESGKNAAADLRPFIAEAKSRGAVAVITTQKLPAIGLPQVTLDLPGVTSILANIYHGRPSAKVAVMGVTGTNGKTTTTYLVRHLLKSVGQRCGMIGTVEVDDGKEVSAASMTTPDAVSLAALIARMRDRGCRGCAMEVSSHALHQGRAAGVHFSAAGFTNLTGDHLDYHGSMEKYAAAKASLFASLDPDAVAVVNADDANADRMIRDCSARLFRFSMSRSKKADYRARDIAITSQGTSFVLESLDGRAEVRMSLIGRHNIENALCASALAGETFHLTVQQIAAGLNTAGGAPGRLQAVQCGQPFAVLVDYAHTDDALENVLTAMRSVTQGKLRVLFGCGGDRDRTKRPRMAKVANRLADAVYVTSDNPRTESPRAILDEVCGGFPSKSRCVLVEEDRRAAIEKIIGDAQAGDVVLIAGKGHENYQILGTTKHHFDDVEECTRLLNSEHASAA